MGIMEYVMNRDKFIDSSQEGQMSITIMTLVGCMTFATVLSLLLFWTYRLDPRICYGILWTLVFIYATTNLIYTIVKAKLLSPTAFKIFLAMHSVMILMAIPLLIYYFVYGVRSFKARKAAAMGSSNSSSSYSRPMSTIAEQRSFEADVEAPDSHSF